MALVSLLFPLATSAQTGWRVAQEENLRLDPRPTGQLLGTVRAGTLLTGSDERSGWISVTLEGWIWARSVRADSRGDFDLRVTASGGENLRGAPNGDVVARLQQGTLLEEAGRDEGWVRVRRTAWMWGQSLRQSEPPPAPSAPEDPAPPASSSLSLERASLGTDTPVAQTPDGDPVGNLVRGTPVRVLARTDDWVRVAVDVWIPADVLRAEADSVLVGVSAAEVRAQPDVYRGRVLLWRVQVVSTQVADALRREIPSGATYLLVRGPLPDVAFAYVIVSSALLSRVRDLEPLAEMTILVRVRAGRSQYLGNPVLDLLDIAPVER